MSSISSAFSRMATMLTLMGLKPASRPASRPARILSSTGRPLIFSTPSGRRESRLTLRRVTPASFKSRAMLANWVALVEMDRSSMPGMAATRRHSSVMFSAQQGLAAGQAQALEAQAGEQADQPLDLVEGQPVVGFLEALEAFRDAIGATQVAAVRDGEPEVFDASSKAINQGVHELSIDLFLRGKM
jgi:hypothetical protein